MDRHRSAPTRNLVIASSFTADPLLRPMSFWLQKLEIDARIELAPYAQLIQQLLDPHAPLARNKNGCNLLLVRVEDWIRDRRGEPRDQNVAHLHQAASEFLAALDTLRERTSAPIVLVLAPSSSAVTAQYDGLFAEIEHGLLRRLRTLKNMHCWTHADLMRLYPVLGHEDAATDAIAHIPFTQPYFVAMATLLARRIAALFKPRFKVVAVDCDNTLWKGVCGEDGADGIELTPAHLQLQRTLKEQHDAGVLLCLCTKNNPGDIEAVFARRQDMLLRPEHFVSSRINWQPKSSNLRDLASELSLGLDSFVFIDDSPLECAEVREHCPPVLTLQLPAAAEEIGHFIDHVWAFDRTDVTEEAAGRTAQYRQNRERSQALAEAGELKRFLATLQLEIKVVPMQRSHLERVAELTQRTNQFNLTTIRRTAGEIDALQCAGELGVYVVHVRDRFGDYGLVGVLMLRPQDASVEVDTFLLSCRALGRGVEFRIVNEIARIARERGTAHIVLRYRPTARNVPARSFLQGAFAQFQTLQVDAGSGEQLYRVPVEFAERFEGEVQAEQIDEERSSAATARHAAGTASHAWHAAALAMSRMPELLRALENASRRRRAVGSPLVAPRTAMEQSVASVWSEVLSIDAVGVDDDFFELGGDSLLAVQLVARTAAALGRELPLHEFFAAPTIEQMSARLLHSPHSEPSIPRLAPDSVQPLSSAQRRLWLIDQIEAGGIAYHIPVSIALRGSLDVAALQASLDLLIERHESLRTVFVKVNGEPVQKILPPARFDLHIVRLHEAGAAAGEAEVQRYSGEQLAAPFDLQRGPLIRGSLLRLDDTYHVLLIIVHHIVSDGWSIAVIMRELIASYEAARAGRPEHGQPLPVQYADYARWQRQWLARPEIEKQRKYWEATLQGAPELLELPTDRPRPPVRSYRGASAAVTLGTELVTALREHSRRQGFTPAMVLYATWFLLMSRLSGQRDVVVGVPVAGRRRAELENLIGLFVNTLAVRVRLTGEESVRELLTTVRRHLFDAYANQDVPFEQVVEAVRPTRSLSHNALFQSMLVLQSAPRCMQRFSDMEWIEQDVPQSTAKFDLTLSLQECGSDLVGSLNYSTDLFDARTIDSWIGAFKVLLGAVLASPETLISRLPLMTAEQRMQVLVSFNDARTAVPRERLIQEVFEEQVQRAPHATAVVFGPNSLTFAELNSKANQLARYLRSQGVGNDDLVALCVERSLEMVIGILGILKAGAAYVPLDPDYPRGRLQEIIEDAKPRVLLVHAHLASELPRTLVPTLEFDDAALERFSDSNLQASPAMRSEQLAYVIYTSGSTGRPKGVMIEHRQVMYLWRALDPLYAQSASCGRVGVNASFSFDASVKQFIQLLSGRALVLIPQQVRWNAEALLELIREQQIEGIDCTPMQLRGWLESGLLTNPGSLRLVLVGGEPIDVQLWSRLGASRAVKFFNVYGPTESTVDATFAHVTDDGGAPHIGRPLANASIYILDPQGQPVPIGAIGELHIGGSGVARGYLRRPALTAERFIADPFDSQPRARMYKTGDLARWRHDGRIEYVGRNDHQVKLRGHRIELGEIEAQLVAHPSIKEAAVLLREDAPGQRRLAAYLVRRTKSDGPAIEDIRQHLKRSLPDYMVPSVFVELDALPKTPNGKLDRRALPAPNRASQVQGRCEAPQGEMEQLVAGIWQELLQTEVSSRDDNFFDLGGHSLLVMEVIARIQSALEMELPMRLLFEAPTVKQLSAELEQLGRVQALRRLASSDSSVDELLEQLASMPESEVETLLRDMIMEERA